MRGLYLITNDDPLAVLLPKLDAALAPGAVKILQYRRKKVLKADQPDEVEQIKALCERHQVPFVINDDLALAAQFGLGVHLGQSDGEIRDAAQGLPPDAIIGRTCENSMQLAEQAIADGAGNAQLKSLKLLQVGGARLSATLAARIPAEIGCQLQQVFGMAEGLVNYTALDDLPERIINTQGRPMCPDDEVWVADEHGNPLPRGEVGRLMTRGPYTFRGYFNSPEHNAGAFDANGFYCSGDLIAIDEQGYITVQGREKDQINRGGEKIAAEEIENLLLRHEAVIHAALVSMEDSLLGEKSCAYLVVKQPLRAVEVRRFLREQGVAEFKLPDRVESVDALPLTPVGKVDKKQLRLRLAERTQG